MSHEGCLMEVYRKYTFEDLGKFYQQGEHALMIFGVGEDVNNLREEISQKNKELQNLVNSLATRNINLRNRVDQIEKEISKIEETITSSRVKKNNSSNPFISYFIFSYDFFPFHTDSLMTHGSISLTTIVSIPPLTAFDSITSIPL